MTNATNATNALVPIVYRARTGARAHARRRKVRRNGNHRVGCVGRVGGLSAGLGDAGVATVGPVWPDVASCAARTGIVPIHADPRHVATGAGVPQWQMFVGDRREG